VEMVEPSPRRLSMESDLVARFPEQGQSLGQDRSRSTDDVNTRICYFQFITLRTPLNLNIERERYANETGLGSTLSQHIINCVAIPFPLYVRSLRVPVMVITNPRIHIVCAPTPILRLLREQTTSHFDERRAVLI
jgi:hypothetical protein